MARGTWLDQRRCATATSARWSWVRPRSLRKRSTGTVNIDGGPKTPYGASYCPLGPDASGARPGTPLRERPDSPCVISTVLAWPAVIAAAAWRTCSMNDVPPTAVVST